MTREEYEKQKRQEMVAEHRASIVLYSKLRKQMQEEKDKSTNEKNIEMFSEIIGNCTREIRKARKELKALL